MFLTFLKKFETKKARGVHGLESLYIAAKVRRCKLYPGNFHPSTLFHHCYSQGQ